MSFSDLRRRNRGAYTSPHSGVGVEFLPLGILPDHSGLVLYETGFLPRNDWWNFPNTLSPFWRLYYNSAPGHRVLFADREIELTPRHFVIIPDHQLFHSRGHVPVPHLWMTFNIARRFAPGQPVPLLLRPTATELAILGDIRSLFRPRFHPSHRQRLFHYSLALLQFVLNRPEIRWQTRPPSALAEMVQHIERNYAAPLHVPDLARMANLSTGAFARAFRSYQGHPPARFLSLVRVREAAHRLVHSDATIDAIADQTGFPNRAYFSRVFKKITGDSPAHFRQTHKA
jgi:AraC family transcriptional regulator, arabinose operon regulatory protein